MAVKRIDHIAVVVDDIDASLAFWRDALGMDMTHLEEVKEQESIVAFLPTGGSEVELVKPTTETSGVAKYLAKRGPGMHHICLEVDNLEEMLAGMKAKGKLEDFNKLHYGFDVEANVRMNELARFAFPAGCSIRAGASFTSRSPVTSRRIFFAASLSSVSFSCFKFRMIWTTSSLTLAMVENSWATPSILTAVTAVPANEERITLLSELPKVIP